MGKKSSVITILLIFLGIYFYLYFCLTNFVFFNFDMPRVALIVKDFLQSGSFLTSQSYFEESVWRNIPWGPSLVFFYSVFLRFSNDPLTISYMLSFVNLGAIIVLAFVLWKNFSKSIALASLFLITTNPYWVTYVRIIYQPSPVTFFIPLSMAIFFEAVFNKKWWAYILLPISWVILFQIYIPTYSFILTSVIFSIFFVKKVNFKFLTIGLFLSFALLIPTFLFLNSNREYLNRYAEAPNLFTPAEKTFSERLINVSKSFVLIPIGGVFEHQTGYGLNDFVTYYLPMYSYITPFFGALVICVLFWNLYKGIFKKDYKRLILCLWAITPVWSMMVLWVSDILPRYYLHAFPAIMILISLFIVDLIKISKIFWLLPIGIISYWVMFNYSYNNFIQNYEYLNGRFRDVAETPYIYFNQAVGWVIKDANQKQCDPVVTNNEENPEFDIWLETKYVWEYIYKRPVGRLRKDLEPCYYVINYKNKVKELGITNFKVFGLYTVFEYNNIKN